MPAGKFVVYTTAQKYFQMGRIDLQSQVIKAYLLKDTYTLGTASHSALGQITSHIATASSTIVNAITLSGCAVTGSGVDTIKFDANDISGFSSDGSTIVSAKYVALVAQSASSGGGIDNLLLGAMNLDTTATSSSAGNATQINITWAAGGIWKTRTNP